MAIPAVGADESAVSEPSVTIPRVEVDFDREKLNQLSKIKIVRSSSANERVMDFFHARGRVVAYFTEILDGIARVDPHFQDKSRIRAQYLYQPSMDAGEVLPAPHVFDLQQVFEAFTLKLAEMDEEGEKPTSDELLNMWLWREGDFVDEVALLNESLKFSDEEKNDRSLLLLHLYRLLEEAASKSKYFREGLRSLVDQLAVPADRLWKCRFLVRQGAYQHVFTLENILKEFIQYLTPQMPGRGTIRPVFLLNLWLSDSRSFQKLKPILDLEPLSGKDGDSDSWLLRGHMRFQQSIEKYQNHPLTDFFAALDRIVRVDAFFSSFADQTLLPSRLKNSTPVLRRSYLLFNRISTARMPGNPDLAAYLDKSDFERTKYQIEEIKLGGILDRNLKIPLGDHEEEVQRPRQKGSGRTKASLIEDWQRASRRKTKLKKPVVWIEVPVAFAPPGTDASYEERLDFVFNILDAVFAADPHFGGDGPQPTLERLRTYNSSTTHVFYYRFSGGNPSYPIGTLLLNLSHILRVNLGGELPTRAEVLQLWVEKRYHQRFQRKIIDIPVEMIPLPQNPESIDERTILQNLFEILTEIVQKNPYFHTSGGEPRPDWLTRHSVRKIEGQNSYALKGGNASYTLESLLKRFEEYLSRHTGRKYTSSQLLELWKKQLPANWKPMEGWSQEDFLTFVKENRLEPLIKIFDDDVEELKRAIRLTHRDIPARILESPFFSVFVRRMVLPTKNDLSRMEPEEALVANSPPVGDSSEALSGIERARRKRRSYLHYIFVQSQLGQVSLEQEFFADQVHLFIGLLGSQMQDDWAKAIEQIEGDIDYINKDLAASDKPQADILQYLNQIYAQVLQYYQELRDLEFPHMRFPPLNFQVGDLYYLISHRSGLLANPTGDGKTYSALSGAEYLLAHEQINSVLYVATANNLPQVHQFIREATFTKEDQIVIFKTGAQIRRFLKPSSRRPRIAASPIKYFLISYGLLGSLWKNNPDLFHQLSQMVGLLILDESQLIDNKRTRRSRAFQDFVSEWKWFISATPYQHDIARIWLPLHLLFPTEFPSWEDFARTYLKDDEGLEALGRRLRQLIRRGRDNVQYFDPPTPEQEAEFTRKPEAKKMFYLEQLKSSGGRRKPQLVDLRTLNPHQGSYYLTSEQTKAIIEIASGNQSIFNKYRAILRIIYPHNLTESEQSKGVNFDNLLSELDRVIEERINKGEKIIVWAFNVRLIELLKARYEKYGLRTFYGENSDEEKVEARMAFKENPEVRLLVANYNSMDVGIDLPEATSAIFAQVPFGFTRFIQARGRHQRIITEKNIHLAKLYAYYLAMVPKYSPEVLKAYQDLLESSSQKVSQYLLKVLSFLRAGTIIEARMNILPLELDRFSQVMDFGGDSPVGRAGVKKMLQRSLASSLQLESRIGSALDVLNSTPSRDDSLADVLPERDIDTDTAKEVPQGTGKILGCGEVIQRQAH